MTEETTSLPYICAGVPPRESEFIRDVLDRIGDKWSLLVIGTLRDGPLRYTQLQGAIPGISQRMLTRTLTQLHRDGLVTRTAYAEVPPRVEYALSELGNDLHGAVNALISWARTHHEQIRSHRTLFDAESVR